MTAVKWAFCLIGMLGLLGCGPKDACEVTPHCLANDYCLEGKCVEVDEAGRCTPAFLGPDGCDYDELCLNTASATDPEFRCTNMSSSCSSNSLENDENYLEKDDDFCLVGRCQSSADCAAGARCLLPDDANHGLCSDAELGSACFSDTDCTGSVLCVVVSEDDPLGLCGVRL